MYLRTVDTPGCLQLCAFGALCVCEQDVVCPCFLTSIFHHCHSSSNSPSLLLPSSFPPPSLLLPSSFPPCLPVGFRGLHPPTGCWRLPRGRLLPLLRQPGHRCTRPCQAGQAARPLRSPKHEYVCVVLCCVVLRCVVLCCLACMFAARRILTNALMVPSPLFPPLLSLLPLL